MTNLPPDWRDQLKAVYPKRKGQGWLEAKKQILKHLKNGESFEEMLQGAKNYRRHVALTGEHVRMAQTFFGPTMWWTEFLDDEDTTNELTLDDQCREYGIERQPKESDTKLKKRLGIAMTNRMYKQWSR